MFKIKWLLFSLLSLIFIGCEGIKKVSDRVFETSARKKYQSGFKGNPQQLIKWTANFENASRTKLLIKDSYSATARFDSLDLFALGYRIPVQRGDKLIINAQSTNQSKIFVDISKNSAANDEMQSELLENGEFSTFIENSDTITVVVQPEIGFVGDFHFQIFTQPSLSFPVAGKGNRDVQSFWGANRDGGARSHEGVDIFAKRGTPVVAATDGYISRTGNSGLGGKQVWLRSEQYGTSLYYAHLDSIIAKDGTRVKTGDTLGTVGSTGNAAGGAPHLHFGIYGMGGASDPYPFIRTREKPAPKTFKFTTGHMIKSGSNLRLGPGTDFPVAALVTGKTSAKVLSGNGEWFQVVAENGAQGFINSGRLE